MQAITLYTDGACSGNPGPGGWACVLLSPKGYVIELGGAESQSTNNRMELKAAIEGLRWLFVRKELSSTMVRLYTDSKYLIQGIESWVRSWKKNGWKTSEGNPVANQDLWEEMDQLREGFSLELHYVPGHEGVPGNERCDEIAVAFSKGEEPDLYQGKIEKYFVDLSPPIIDKKASVLQPYYLSLVDGHLYRDKTWADCEKRVKGRKGAKYKKLKSAREEATLLKSWGIVD